ncbi:MAG: ABC transporter permease [Ezakiella coagulans]|uniref:ABC transporter permease n=1 Tax=Ezakiella coagulans TaxID=46507 RepID=UPI00399A52CC
MKRFKLPVIVYGLWAIFFILVPLLLILLLGFSIDKSGKTVFSFANFKRFFSPIYLSILWASFKLAFFSTLICLLIGYPFAWFIAKKKNSDFYMILIMIPMWMNFLLRTYAWLTLLGRNGLVNSFLVKIGIGQLELMYNNFSIMVGMVYNYLPFMILPIFTAITKLDYGYIEAGYDLGATPQEVFRKVIFPLTKGGVITGITMTFIPAISTFVISQLLGGNNINLIGNIIEQQFRYTGDWNFGSAISIVLIIIILVLIKFSLQNADEDGIEGGII